VIGLVAAGVRVVLVESGLSGVRPDEVAYRQLADPPMSVVVAVVWKDEKQLPLVQEPRQIAREVTQPHAIAEQR
jgi:hypothetical protein